jgi:methylmalonyl-CoA/ethylmalonyl-CoA epimerase
LHEPTFLASEQRPERSTSSVIGIDHIAIAVADLDEGIRWYVQNLGFRVVEKRVTYGESTSMLSAVLKAGSVTLVLVQGTCPRSQVSRFLQRFGPGVQHFALEVTDLESALVTVKGAGGASDTTLIQGSGIRQVFLRRDPGSGARVELIERRGGNFTDASVAQLFREFEAKELI